MNTKRYMRNQITGVLAVLCGALALASQWLFGASSNCIAANTYDAAVDIHCGSVNRTNDAAVTARHLLWKDGATAGTTIALSGATNLPLGTVDNIESSTGLTQKVILLGKEKTVKMVASEAMATIGVKVYAAASGKIGLTGVVLVGRILTAAGADGDVVEVESCFPRVEPNGVNTVAGATLAIPVTKRRVSKTTGGAEALTLANGLPGQRLSIELAVDGGDGTLTPTTKSGFTAIVFADALDIAELEYVDDTVGWIIVGLSGAAAPPAFS
ncbi:MAG: hypothetical protein K9N47_05565 [Prosthecobacter sp.]|uniref:hypothetical protein n=1 Tax=Prosthecobacter sp. TaxID=1965333 RepID=UPI0025EFA183|nr:hypothetical protein [Prosthecobacter sp.]MCF7785568.1 hypothetical protein [Prosthecobacter sp.]